MWALSRRKGPCSRLAARAARSYADAYRDFSFDFHRNGEKWLLCALAQARSVQTIFDVGSHTGEWAMLALKHAPQATIHCFEPSPRNFAMLTKQLASSRCIVNNIGLGGENTRTLLKEFTDKECTTGNTLVTDFTRFDGTQESCLTDVRVRRGDEYCEEQCIKEIDFLKIDVEGYEPSVLRGFDSLLKIQCVRCVQFEYGYHHGDVRFLMKDFFSFFESYGYRVGRLWSRGVAFSDFRYELNNFTSGPNFVAIPTADSALYSSLNRPL